MAKFFWIDSFADAGPVSGNPAGVCLLERPAPEAWMKDLAAELALSETAFAYPLEAGNWNLRWFTPSRAEVKLCGHATLAAAQALLLSSLESGRDAIRFQTLSGELRAWRRKDDGLIELDFPEQEVQLAEAPAGLFESLGLSQSKAQAQARLTGYAGEDWLVEIDSEGAVRELKPDFLALAKLGGRGICVTAKAEAPGADFVSRFFGPAVGINEDPVTGSAHCYLGPWWAAKLGSRELMGRQLSARGGLIRVSLKNGRAFLAGEARLVIQGSVQLPT